MNRGNSLATSSSSQLSGESARPTGGGGSIFAAGLFAAAPASAAIITFDEAPPSLVHGVDRYDSICGYQWGHD